MIQAIKVLWPKHNHPKNCPLHIQNELNIEATPERVWAWLIHATLWPTWYENSKDVIILSGSKSHLEMNSVFSWKTMGINVNCTVVEYIPNERIAWSGRVYGIDIYHAWVLDSLESGCGVLTEETQRGLLVVIGKRFLSDKIFNAHQLWLKCLEEKALSGLPTTA